MSPDMVKMLLIAIVAYVAYTVLFKDGGMVKNRGLMNVNAPITTSGNVSGHTLDDANPSNVLDHPQMSNNYSPQGNFDPINNFASVDCFPKDQIAPHELLPAEGGFAESNPATQGHLSNRNLFESGHHAGLNTQSSSHKNGNRQLRSDPLIPRKDVGPWHQSTYESDTNRRQFEIGSV